MELVTASASAKKITTQAIPYNAASFGGGGIVQRIDTCYGRHIGTFGGNIRHHIARTQCQLLSLD
jgi:hypothetical protein